MKRKEFIKTMGRLLMLGGITASTAYLFTKNKVSATCSVSVSCDNCGKLQNCELPQAKEVKDGK